MYGRASLLFIGTNIFFYYRKGGAEYEGQWNSRNIQGHTNFSGAMSRDATDTKQSGLTGTRDEILEILRNICLKSEQYR